MRASAQRVRVPEIVPVLEASDQNFLLVVVRYVMGGREERPLWERALENRKVRQA